MKLSFFQILFLIVIFFMLFSNSVLSRTIINSFNSFLQNIKNYTSTRK